MAFGTDIHGFSVGTPHQRRRARRIAAVRAKRYALLGLGASLIVVGIASVPTPVPIGFVLFALGLYFLARGSKKARRSIKQFRRRTPLVSRGLNNVKHRLPDPLRVFIERSDPGI
jgi:Flp pilus assembly protein TadB